MAASDVLASDDGAVAAALDVETRCPEHAEAATLAAEVTARAVSLVAVRLVPLVGLSMRNPCVLVRFP
ncbi:MAG: hypothetical protein ABI112_02775 [Terracoccus sp.]